MKRYFKDFAVFAALMITLVMISATAKADDELDVKPRLGVFFNQGEDLDEASILGGVQVDWDIDDTFNIRLGVEYTEADVSDGSELQFTRIPLMIVSEIKQDAPLRNVYFGVGGVRTLAQYSDGHYPDVTGWGPTLMLGWMISRHFSGEFQWDNMRKYDRQYGGFSLVFTYDAL